MGSASMGMLPPALPQQPPLSVSPTPAFSQSNPAGCTWQNNAIYRLKREKRYCLLDVRPRLEPDFILQNPVCGHHGTS